MKRFILLLMTMSFLTVSYAQVDEENQEPVQKNDEMITLMSKSKSVGGYGSISVLYSNIDSRDAFVFGARGAVVLGHMFAIGLGGSGFVSDFEHVGGINDDLMQGYAGGYGGLLMEPIFLPRLPVHISVPILVGAGGVALTTYERGDNNDDDNSNVEGSDAFLVIEPGIELEMNVTKFFRVSLGGYYRYTSDLDFTIDNGITDVPVDPDLLKNFSFGINLKFGKF